MYLPGAQCPMKEERGNNGFVSIVTHILKKNEDPGLSLPTKFHCKPCKCPMAANSRVQNSHLKCLEKLGPLSHPED